MADDRERQRRTSDATSISLVQLDPSPIESPAPYPEVEKKEELLSRSEEEEEVEGSSYGSIKSGSTSTVGLSGSGRSAIYYLTRIHKYSSYATSIFTSLHLANVSLIPASTGSVDASETYLLMTREIYQTVLTEPLLVILPVVAHVGSGIALRLIRRAQNVKRYGRLSVADFDTHGNASRHASAWPSLSWISVSGYVFTILYSAHVATNRLLPLAVDGDSSNIGLAYVAHGFARHPAVSWLAYTGLIGIGVGHMVWGTAKWLGLAPSTVGWLQPRNSERRVMVDKKTRKERRRKWLTVHGVALGAMGLWAVGGLGVVARGGASDGWVGKIYDNLFNRIGL